MKLLYNLFIFLYPKIAFIISPFNQKAGLWIKGRIGLFRKLRVTFQQNNAPVVWMHCSSLGEFEQGRPLLEAFKQQYPTYRLLLTFFSPSGYEVRKHYDGADWVFYLPMDSKRNAASFLNIVKPAIALFVKYEFWYYYLTIAKERNIPVFLVSGVFRESQPFFKWYGGLYRKMLGCYHHLFLQNEFSDSLLRSINIKNVSVSGDTRFDRVMAIAGSFTSITLIEQFIEHNDTLVAGSTWLEDDEELCHYANNHPEIKFIIAPHDISAERIKECKRLYKNAVLFSEITNHLPGSMHTNILIIDNIGMLSRLYRYATIAYIGGAFGEDGVHNVLEAAVFYKPVVFGPVYEKYAEATALIGCGGGFSIDSALSLEIKLNELFLNRQLYGTAAQKAGDFVKSHAGAAQKIMEYFYENRLLIN
ncbi:MAG: 3-deoxy-D-manno-octulosonic acid transferase [Sphingobacteriia bacterium]|nr:3-deoxy-D-manno-octulosonic acid transferase [Sphingobacteriia bacterium]